MRRQLRSGDIDLILAVDAACRYIKRHLRVLFLQTDRRLAERLKQCSKRRHVSAECVGGHYRKWRSLTLGSVVSRSLQDLKADDNAAEDRGVMQVAERRVDNFDIGSPMA